MISKLQRKDSLDSLSQESDDSLVQACVSTGC